MTAFLKIDTCAVCKRAIPWEWAPAIIVGGKTLAGTGVWRSQLFAGHCPSCQTNTAADREKEKLERDRQSKLMQLLGGHKPYRDFTFERYEPSAGNQNAYERFKHFDPAVESLYVWGACGIGKTHLAYAAARRAFEETLSVIIVPAYRLSRRVRMKDPEQEQAELIELSSAEVLVLDDLGSGPDTAYSRQILQEILDGRDFSDRAGLIVTSKYSLDGLAAKLDDDTIPSRLAGMCKVISMTGPDRRLPTSRG